MRSSDKTAGLTVLLPFALMLGGLFTALATRSSLAFVVGLVGLLWLWLQAPRKTTTRVRPRSRTVPQDVKIAVSVRDGGRCRICGSTKDLQYDHIIPFSKGGRSDDPNNIQLLCGYHNRLKRDR